LRESRGIGTAIALDCTVMTMDSATDHPTTGFAPPGDLRDDVASVELERPLPHLRMDLSSRWKGDAVSHATSWTASIGLHRMTSWNLNVYVRSSRFGMDPVDRLHIEAIRSQAGLSWFF
jgi:hypothetical protein